MDYPKELINPLIRTPLFYYKTTADFKNRTHHEPTCGTGVVSMVCPVCGESNQCTGYPEITRDGEFTGTYLGGFCWSCLARFILVPAIGDTHRMRAAIEAEINEEDVTALQRQVAKMLNFAEAYSQSGNLTIYEAHIYLPHFHPAYDVVTYQSVPTSIPQTQPSNRNSKSSNSPAKTDWSIFIGGNFSFGASGDRRELRRILRSRGFTIREATIHDSEVHF